MTEALATVGVHYHPDHRMLVALAPEDVPSQQAEMKAWCEQKIAALRVDEAELDQSVQVAQRSKWASATLKKHRKATQDQITYFEKVLAAVEAGYLVVPNFDVDVMAIRVSDTATPQYSTDRYRATNLDRTSPELLPVESGQYVNPLPVARRRYFDEPTDSEPKRRVLKYEATDEFRAMQFPVTAVKPVILEATQLALSRRIFDSIGVVTGRKQDPLVIGTIFDPRDRWRSKRVSFFVAWWFDTRSL